MRCHSLRSLPLACYHLAVFPGPLSQAELPETGLFDSLGALWVWIVQDLVPQSVLYSVFGCCGLAIPAYFWLSFTWPSPRPNSF